MWPAEFRPASAGLFFSEASTPVKSIARAFAAVALLCASVAHADGTVEERQEAVKLYRGSTIIAASDPRSAVYVPNFTPAACEQLRESRWQAEALTRTSGEATYKCQVEQRAIIRFHPAPTCPPLPPPEGRVVDCPAGYTGAYTQTLSYSAAPYPTCAVPGEWMPTTPPASCVPIDSDNDGVPDSRDECPTVQATSPNGCPATPPAQLAAPTNVRAEGISTSAIRVTWDAVTGAAAYSLERCIGATCTGFTQLLCVTGTGGTHTSLPANLTARYRVRASRDAACGTAAGNLGAYSAIVSGTTLSVPAGTASVGWTPPTQNTDGTALTNLAGYRISYGTDPNALVHTLQIANPGVSSYTVGNLAPGTWHFAVRAYTSGGTESVNSNVTSKIIQ
jgi:hypothetical protein